MEEGEDSEQRCEKFVDESEVDVETADEESTEGALLRLNGNVKTENVEDSEQRCEKFVDESEVDIETADDVSSESALLRLNGNVKTENGDGCDDSCSQGTGTKNIISSVERVGDAISDLREASSWQQYNSEQINGQSGTLKTTLPCEVTLPVKSKRGRKPKGYHAQLQQQFNKDDPKHLQIPFTHGWRSREVTPPIKSKRGRKPKGYNAKPEKEFNKDDLKHLEIPFTLGWRRELVLRNPSSGKCHQGSSMCDVYYFPPEGKKLRSMVEISAFLNSHPDSQVNLTHFTFRRKNLFKPPYEIVRAAGNVRKLPDVHTAVPEKRTKSSVSNTDISKPAQKSFQQVKITTKKPACSDLVKRLTTANMGPQIQDKDTAERVEHPAKSVIHSESQTTAPVRMTAAKEPVFHQPVTAAQLLASRKTGLKRIRQQSPDWTPKLSMKKRNVGIIKQTVATASLNNDHDGGGGNLQTVLGTPSRFIASIVRFEPSKTAENVIGNSDAVTQHFTLSTSSPAKASVGNCNDQAAPRILLVSSAPSSNSTRVCSRNCPGMGGIEPYHPCIQCGRPYHLMCTTDDPNSPRPSLCLTCGKKGLKSSLMTPSNPSVIRLNRMNMQKLSSLPVALHRLTSLSGPVPSSMVPVSSAFINSPLMTSSQLMPQVLSPIMFIPGQNAAAIPPPPPLASRPQFETVTIVPLNFTSNVPPPPRLQFCSIPQTGQSQLPPPLHPAPLLLSNSMLFSSPTNSTITQLPVLHSLLPSKPVALQKSDTSVGVGNTMYIDTPPRSLLTHTSPAQTHVSSAEPSHSSFLKHGSSASPASEANVPQSTYHNINNTSKDETGQDANSTSNQAWRNEPVSGRQEGFDLSGLGNQAGQNVLGAVKQLVSKRTRSESVSSDSLDSLPVQFQPSDANISGQQLEKSSAKEVDSDCLEHTTKEAVQQLENKPDSESQFSILKGILSKPSVDIVREQGVAPSVVLDSGDSMLSGSSTMHVNSDVASIVAATTEEADIQLEKSDATPLAVAATEATDIPMEMSEPLGVATTEETDIQMEAKSIAAATAELANIHSADVVHTDASGVTYSKDVPSTIRTFQFRPQPSSSSNHSETQSRLNVALKHPVTVKLGQAPIPPGHPQQESGSGSRKTARKMKMYLSSFRVLHGSFPVVMKIFTYLSPVDLLRASAVCKLWHMLALQPSLWQCVRLKGIQIHNWDEATQFFHQNRVRSLNFKDLEASSDVSAVELWDSIRRTVPTLTELKELFFHKVPASVLNSLTEKMPNLVNISAEHIVDSEVFNSAPPATVDRTVINMSHAVDAVITGKLPTKEAANRFRVSENDLIHLAQAAGKLTEDEERAVILCCLRLSHMGFCIQLDTLVSKCQEMFARRYSTTTAIPVSDSYVRDLYICNQPLFMTDTEIASSNSTQQRLDAHYSVLQKLYKSLWPRLTPSPFQILVFDLKHFHLGRDPAFNTVRSVSATVFSTMSAGATCLPSMAVWPRYVNAKHTSLINVISSRGLPAYHHVYTYFQKILKLVKIRPLVILFNGNASLLSEKLVTSCVMDSVYFYCVPPDIAKYVFPGFHGGLLHMLKSYVPAEGLSCEDFASVILFLLNKKLSLLQQSARQAFITTGAFPINPKAPFQYQTNNCLISQGQPVSLLQSNTINLLKGHLASVRQQQQMPSVCDVMVTETVVGDQAAPGKNTEHDISATSRFRTQNKNKSENTGKHREEKQACITNKDTMQAQKVDNKAVKYTTDKENKRRNKRKGLQENNAIVIGDEVEENNAIVICDEVEKNNAIVICDKVEEDDAILIYDDVQENDGVVIHDEVHKSIVDTICEEVQQSNEAATSEVQASSVDAISNQVDKDQPVKVAKTVVGVRRKNKKCSNVQLLARMLLNQAKRNMFVRTKLRHIFESHGMEAEFRNSSSTNKYSLTDHSGSGRDQKKPQAETDLRGPVKGSSGKDQAKPQTLTDPRVPVGGNNGRDDGKPQTDMPGPVKGSSGRNQETSQTLTDPTGAVKGRSREDQEKSQTRTDLRGPVKDNNERDQTQTDPQGPVKGSTSAIRASASKPDLIPQLQDKEWSCAALDSSLQAIGSIPNHESVQTIHIEQCTDNTRRPETKMDISDIEGEFRNRMNESRGDSENNHRNKRIRNRMTEQQSTPKHQQDISFDGEESIKKKKKKKHKKKKRHQMKEKIGDKYSSEADELTLKDNEISSGNSVAGHRKGNEGMEAEEEETAVPEELCDFSLIDHDYIVRYDVSGRAGQGGAAEDPPDISECADRPGKHVDVISSNLQKSERERHAVGGDIIYVAADENVAETLVSSSLCEDAEVSSTSDSSSSSCSSCSKCGRSSDSSSSDEEESSPSKVDSGNTAEKLSSSDNESSKCSDEEVEENAGDDNSTNSQDNDGAGNTASEEDSSNSGQTTDEEEEEEEEEEEDDESLCQLCMRAVPPHSKDEIIDWMDCDKNCGRWFHVICITRSQARADKKTYICPSCRCI